MRIDETDNHRVYTVTLTVDDQLAIKMLAYSKGLKPSDIIECFMMYGMGNDKVAIDKWKRSER